MKVIDVYEQYFSAEGEYNGIERKGVKVELIATSEEGNIRYEAQAVYFPHRDEEDYGITYDAVANEVLYDAKGRRSKKKEEAYLKDFREVIDRISAPLNCKVLWEKPLREERRG